MVNLAGTVDQIAPTAEVDQSGRPVMTARRVAAILVAGAMTARRVAAILVAGAMAVRRVAAILVAGAVVMIDPMMANVAAGPEVCVAMGAKLRPKPAQKVGEDWLDEARPGSMKTKVSMNLN